LKYFLQLSNGVKGLHERNFMHRDIKAKNILLFNQESEVKICDFGRCKMFEEDEDNSISGTKDTIAPEIMKGEKFYDKSVDIFSLGCVFYQLITFNVFYKIKKDKNNVL
jgi:serine/threonine protein kinase